MELGVLMAMGRIQPGWGTSEPGPTLETSSLFPTKPTGAINFKPKSAHLVNEGRPILMDFQPIVWINYH